MMGIKKGIPLLGRNSIPPPARQARASIELTPLPRDGVFGTSYACITVVINVIKIGAAELEALDIQRVMIQSFSSAFWGLDY